MEIMVVLIIVGVVAAFTLPNFNSSTQQAYSQAAKNNLLAIYTAQVNHFNDNNAYCIAYCDNLADINKSLNLNIADSVYQYICVDDPTRFLCKATNGSTTLTIQNGVNGNPNCYGPYCPYLS
jgi:type II secretory pathway pseudopilin PulG